MSDRNQRGGGKLGKLIELAQSRKDTTGTEQNLNEHEDLELDVADPAKHQATPDELSTEVHDDPLPSDGDEPGKKKDGILSRLSLKQRVTLIVIIIVAFIGLKPILMGSESDIADINEAATQAISDRQSDDMDSALEPINNDRLGEDQNAIDVTRKAQDETDAQAQADEMVSLDPPVETATPSPSLAPPDTGRSEAGDDKTAVNGDMPVDANGQPSQLPGSDSLSSSELSAISEEIVTLRNSMEDLSHSVSSIERSMAQSSDTSRHLANEVTKLMEELKKKDSKLSDWTERPPLRDLVIFTAAANCESCVPHAIFSLDSKEYEVGDQLSWNGYNVTIEGDRMTLQNDNNEFHYWYR